jgi:hypothetical protein
MQSISMSKASARRAIFTAEELQAVDIDRPGQHLLSSRFLH